VIDSGEKALAWPDPSTHALHYIALQLVTFGLEELREPELALRLAQRACTIESDTFGEASWFKLEALWLAQLQTGDLEEAAATRRRALARMEDSNPALAGSAEYFATLLALAEDDSVSSRTNALAWISILAPRPGGAQWAKVVLDREIRVMGEFAESSIPARHVLALLLADAGDFNEAEGLLRRNIELRIRTHGGARWQDELSLGVVLAELREHDEAMPLIERAYPSALDEPDPIRRAYYMRKTESAMADMTGHRR
jgi:tetratricopeptide (TPR) repeat protein